MNLKRTDCNEEFQAKLTPQLVVSKLDNTDDILLETRTCVQRTVECAERFQAELEDIRKHIHNINGIHQCNSGSRQNNQLQDIDNMNFQPNGIHREDANDTGLEQLTNKTEHLLLQVKMQVDLIYLDFEQLKTNVILRPRPILEGNRGIDQDEEVLNGHDDRVLTKSNTRFDQSECDFENCENWPPFVYMNRSRNKFNKFKHNVCCVLQTKPNTFKQTDLLVHTSDTDEDLAKCLESNDEQILSSLVTLESRQGSVLHVENPLYIYLPAVDHKQHLLPKLKYMTNGNEWHKGETVQGISLPTEKEMYFLGTELQIKKIQSIQCVAVAMPPYESFSINGSESIVQLQNDRNITLKFPSQTFLDDTNVTTKVKLLSNTKMKEASNRYLELEHVRQTTSLVTINCSQPTQSDIMFNIHDFTTNGAGINNMSENQETLQRCRRWLVNNLSVDNIECHLGEVLHTDSVQTIMDQLLNTDKVHMLIDELLKCPDRSVEKFIDKLEENGQTDVADRLCFVREQVILRRKQENLSLSQQEELELGSDFDPDFELEKVHILSRCDDQPWDVKPFTVSQSSPYTYTVKLEAGRTSFNVLGVVVPDKMLKSDVCRTASVIEDMSCLTNVTLILRQHRENPDDVVIHCIRSDNAKQRLQELASMGYTQGPSKTSEFGMLDGEHIELQFNCNICLEGYESKHFMMTFYSRIDVAKYVGRLCVLNPDRQIGFDRYSGKLVYKVISSKISIQRCGTMVIYLPKPTDEQLGYFSYTLDFAGKALAKFIAWKLTSDNANSTRWIKNANVLVKDPNVYKYSVNHINRDLHRANQRQRCEAFLLYWSSNYVGHEENKLERMMDSFGTDSQGKYEAQQFIRPYCLSGTLSNESLRKLAYCLAEDWEVMAKKLGLGQTVINEIKSTHKKLIRQSLKMLDIWRLSDAAILKGTDLIKYFYECAKSAKCSSKLLNMTIGHS